MNKADIDALKAANPILDVLRDLGIEVQNNRFRCPRKENHANGDRTPSVSLWIDRGQFKCWVCPDVKGDVIDLVRLAQGGSFREALDFLGKRSGASALGQTSKTRPLPFTSRPMSHPAHSVGASEPGSTGSRPSEPRPSEPSLSADSKQAAKPAARKSREETEEDSALRVRVLKALLEACVPIGGKVAQYLQKRRIFKRTWDGQRLRMIDDYAAISRKLETAFGLEALERTGIFNPAGHLRFYRHKLLFPYFNREGHAVYMQARTIEADIAGPRGPMPKELSLSGSIPLPYNCGLLNGEPGQIYLCEGVIDTLTLIEQGFPAVGIPGAANFKPAWADLFRHKSVHVAFDPDVPGESGAAKAIDILQAHGIEARRLVPPPGKDLNDWFQKG